MSDFETVTATELHTAAPGPAGEPNAPGQPHTMEVSKPRSAAADAWRDLRRRPLFWAAVAIALLVLVITAVPSLFTSGDPLACSLSNQNAAPSGAAIFGYDYQGCDVYTRAIYGTRNSMMIGFFSALFAGFLAILAGLTSGFFGGWIDAVISRVVDIVLGLPLILAGLVLMNRIDNAGGGNGARIAGFVLILGGLGWTTAARVVRSSVITAKNQDYVAAARMLGAGSGRIMLRHILPNALAPFLVVITIALGTFIAAEASLSFLGVGLEPPAQSWGQQISAASPIGLVRTNPIPLLVPSTFLALTVLAFIIMGDKIREAFDPKLR
ncbi:ABC transporter permease [Catellatospora bangladeshensis]|uniref:ABC transporter permease n=1 Tax=Catellatospora bangladeshensis TaxID=310355 RepID=A0A8J3JEM3_9ACTN|nr:ABC transporter permease [Catellatospora bangladeshensis]GIF79246.1 ABC transporter permease [Catellatospora bangladeshensis]